MHPPQWLQSFTALAHTGSFTRAAESLGLTQAAVSQHVRQLEDRLGPLLIRRPRAIELTPAGAALLRYCGEIEEADRRLAARLADEDACCGDVGLITPGSLGLFIYPLLLEFQLAHPGLAIRHKFAPDRETLEQVLDKRYDLGIVALKPDDPRLAASRFAEEALELVVPAGAPVNSWADLQVLGFIDHPEGHAMATRLLSRVFPGNPGIASVPSRGFSNQVGLFLEPVARGLGFTVIPTHARRAFARPDAIRVIDTATPVVDTLWLIHRAEWPLPARARRVADHLREHISERTIR
ncbi:LysR family transcriptional regulator [Massilia dura]|uniref:LysR family transcriptional regulator n=1 Tax=Pseudoduganella dura TaxID=321982 RepID=A0A6I3XNZ8_9BURK|nr:LysR family transcriptional regulator [Pseudoduganella dura]MUI15451.1 LysR family transcriptional regulator [Pseudoduganella dura]GGX79825.1 LysR family transcriptional regulator [Pseudoduganella dura]